ncbi:FUN14 domain-containing protein 1 isoform X2 [Chionomys nivalis]|uniref:FUN14 domain-containing protein 1 isoform X2 n=1 Tax=Chionomys nivalis TaxID=269649 RepID=UPI00259A66B9|nr:FUN14 domain-containing protein 1 isoform X2 [Chionomys nivalis]
MASRNPPPQDYESDDESYEVLDLTEYARRHHWWNRVFGHSSGPMVEKYSVATQIVMGGVTGWCAGFLFQKVGKLAATAVGGGFLLLQNLHLAMDGDRDRDPHWSTGLSSQGPNEEQKEGEHEQGSQDCEECTHPPRQWG